MTTLSFNSNHVAGKDKNSHAPRELCGRIAKQTLLEPTRQGKGSKSGG